MTGEWKTITGWLVFILSVILTACTGTAPFTPISLVQLYVSRDGWYRVSGAQLQGAGIDLNGTDPATFQLFHAGHEAAIRVRGKGKDLTLDFYGQASGSPYSPYGAYQLRWGRENGKRIPDVRMSSPTTVTRDSSQETIVVTRPALYIPQAGEPGKRWFWQALTAPASTTVTLMLPSAAPGSAQFRVDLWGNSQDTANPDHHVVAFLNDTPVADETWDGPGAHPLNLSGTVRAEENRLRLDLPGDTGAVADVVLLQSMQITYTQRLVAQDDLISLEASRGSTRVEGFSDGAVDVFDVTNPYEPRRVADASVTAGTITFGNDSDGIHKWLGIGPRGYRSVDRILPVVQANVRERSRQADYVVVTDPDFVAALEPLVRWRKDHGLKPVVVTTQEIYSEYTFGEESPLALRAYLNSLERKPRFVLLVGKASYDYRNYLNAPNRNLVPTFLVDTLHLNQVASDNWFAATAPNDQHPAFAIGRIPAKTADQVKQVVDKVIRYEASKSGEIWEQRALFIADDKDEAFTDMAKALAGQTPQSIAKQTVYLKDKQGDLQAARGEILSDWNAGVFALTYVGHGSIDTWAEGPLLSSEDLPQLKNGDRLPILFTPTCLDGFFYHPQKDSLTEDLLFKPDGGIVAGIAPTGVSVPVAQSALMNELFREMFYGGTDTLGEAMLHAKQKMNAQDAEMREVINTFGLLGDPALRIAR